MGRKLVLLAALLAGVATALAVTSCGGSSAGDLPAADAQQLNSELSDVQTLFNQGGCTAASQHVDGLIARIQSLPDSVDSDLRQALANGANHLKNLLDDPKNCPVTSTGATTTTPSTTPTTTTSTTTTETKPTTPTTTPTTTTTSTTTTSSTTGSVGGGGGIGVP
jgi:hypothetical protein